jgi:hypothetical protein
MRRWTLPSALCCAGALLLAAAESSPAQGTPVIRIEEDWLVEIAEPDPEGNAPQIVTATSSTEQLEDVHAVFELNHASLPTYSAGGMQLQVWSGELLVDLRPSTEVGVLATNGEVITWTMKMSVGNGRIRFDVDDGDSTTWNNFGHQGQTISTLPTSQTDLGRYRPETSVAHSYVGFASHRVRRYVLSEVRYYSADGLLSTDTTERVVHELPSGDGN